VGARRCVRASSRTSPQAVRRRRTGDRRAGKPNIVPLWSCSGQDRHDGVVAVQPFGREDLSFHAPQQGEYGAAGPFVVGQSRQTERHAFPGIAFGLAIEMR
jgi:hypothetical protein